MRYGIKLSYNGTNYHGWQNQPNTVTVQGELEKALHTLLKKPTEITGCGRTDTGVHAYNYIAHFDTEKNLDYHTFSYQFNALLPQTIVIHNIFKVNDDFHARFDATLRTYKYYILNKYDPFRLETSWQIPHRKLNVEAMNLASSTLLKHTDFKSFSKSKTDVKTYNCNIKEAFWICQNNELVFTISANRFLRNMVRAIVGTLINVGEGKLNLNDFESIILAKNRNKAGVSVPAKGLFLHQIKYNSI